MSVHQENPEARPLLADETTSPVYNEDPSGIPEENRFNTQLAFKIFAAMYSFSILGLFNSSMGAQLPLLRDYYNLTDVHVSVIFLVGPLGYIVAALSSGVVHQHFGQRGVAIVGPIFLVLATGIISLAPAFGLVLAAFAIQGLGTGLLDGSWCAWAGSMPKANTISGLLHGSYSVGGAVGPFLVAVIRKNNGSWNSWYTILAINSIIGLVLLATSFRHESAAVYRQRQASVQLESSIVKADYKDIFKHAATWICAIYFLAYVGTETAISGWIVSFMERQRHADPYLAGLSSSLYWTGMAIGRLVLGFATDRIGVRRATALYFLTAIVLEALFAVLTSPIVSVVLMAMLGFIMGPMFPSAVVVLTRLLPAELHVAAVSFVASLGQVGGALLPFAIGAFVQTLGIGVFRYAILAQTILSLGVWLVFARLRRRAETA